jgi:hypothetical protein
MKQKNAKHFFLIYAVTYITKYKNNLTRDVSASTHSTFDIIVALSTK